LIVSSPEVPVYVAMSFPSSLLKGRRYQTYQTLSTAPEEFDNAHAAQIAEAAARLNELRLAWFNPPIG
jgi:hypothetical protein